MQKNEVAQKLFQIYNFFNINVFYLKKYLMIYYNYKQMVDKFSI